MLRKLLLACVLLLSAGAVADDLPNNKANNWIHKEINALKKDNLILNWASPIKSTTASTRAKYAAIVQSTVSYMKYVSESIEARMKAPAKEKKGDTELSSDIARAKAFHAHVEPLGKLLDFFKKDLTAANIKADTLKKNLTETSKKLSKIFPPPKKAAAQKAGG